MQLIGLAYVDLVLTFGIERGLRAMFPAKSPPTKGYMVHMKELARIEAAQKMQ